MSEETKHIVIADDDADDCQMLTEAIMTVWPEATIHCSYNGLKLMLLLNKVKPYAIFLDVNMPIKNGLDCLTEIRGNEQGNEGTRIVMYSTSSYQDTVDESYKRGANYYIVKPMTVPGIAATLTKLKSDERFISNLKPAHGDFVFAI